MLLPSCRSADEKLFDLECPLFRMRSGMSNNGFWTDPVIDDSSGWLDVRWNSRVRRELVDPLAKRLVDRVEISRAIELHRYRSCSRDHPIREADATSIVERRVWGWGRIGRDEEKHRHPPTRTHPSTEHFSITNLLPTPECCWSHEWFLVS